MPGDAIRQRGAVLDHQLAGLWPLGHDLKRMLLVTDLAALEIAHAHEIEAQGLGLRFDNFRDPRDIRHAISNKPNGKSGSMPVPGGTSLTLLSQCRDEAQIGPVA